MKLYWRDIIGVLGLYCEVWRFWWRWGKLATCRHVLNSTEQLYRAKYYIFSARWIIVFVRQATASGARDVLMTELLLADYTIFFLPYNIHGRSRVRCTSKKNKTINFCCWSIEVWPLETRPIFEVCILCRSVPRFKIQLAYRHYLQSILHLSDLITEKMSIFWDSLLPFALRTENPVYRSDQEYMQARIVLTIIRVQVNVRWILSKCEVIGLQCFSFESWTFF